LKIFITYLIYFSFSLIFAQINLETSKFNFDGELRGRYESLNGQFREGKSGSDQLLLFRTLLHFNYGTKNKSVGIEIQDSRTYLGTTNTPLSSSFTNTTDILQAYLKLKTKPLFFRQEKGTLKLGRQTISISSKRQIERVSYANVIRAYSGAYYKGTNTKKDELHLFYVFPVTRSPKNKTAVLNNTFEWDAENWDQHIWAAHYRNYKPFNSIGPDWAEVFIYGFDEQDTKSKSTADRLYITSGFRLFDSIEARKINYDIEFGYRAGSRQVDVDFTNSKQLSVKSYMLLFKLGYTIKLPIEINFSFQHYEASGDKDPNDHTFHQFERMFGGRRTDLNNTSIHGPLTPSNLSATGFRIELKPDSKWDARLHYSYVVELDFGTQANLGL